MGSLITSDILILGILTYIFTWSCPNLLIILHTQHNKSYVIAVFLCILYQSIGQ